MSRVFVLSANKTPLMPCFPARARELLRRGKAKVFRRVPFTIILTQRQHGEVQPVEAKGDPGSKTSGVVLVGHFKRGSRVIFAMHMVHRGGAIRDALDARRAIRRSRRGRHTRYRAPRFDNRRRPAGWLPPSLQSRVDNIRVWVSKLRVLAPVTAIALERVRFDMQQLQDPEIEGVAYQRGELFGYEVREYLLDKWQRTCAYCDAKNVPLEVEHITPRSLGGSNRVSNLTLACRACNQKKGSVPVAQFVKNPARLARILARRKRPLNDAAAVNATRYAIGEALSTLGLPIGFWTGGRTKFNRCQQGYPKDHWIDAACVGESGRVVHLSASSSPLIVQAEGRGTRQMCLMDGYGFQRAGPKAQKRVFGFQTGDMVRAVVPGGKKAGTHVGRVAVRATGNFNIKVSSGVIQGISYKHCVVMQRLDGYSYRMGQSDALRGRPDEQARCVKAPARKRSHLVACEAVA